MHSTEILRTDSFEFQVDGEPVTHADYFQSFTKTRRLGLLAPNRIDGFGAIGSGGHTPDERIEIASLEARAKLAALTLHRAFDREA